MNCVYRKTTLLYYFLWPLYLTIVIKITQEAMRSVYPLLSFGLAFYQTNKHKNLKLHILYSLHTQKRRQKLTNILFTITRHIVSIIYFYINLRTIHTKNIYGSVMSSLSYAKFNIDFLKILLFPFLAKRNCLFCVLCCFSVAFYTKTHTREDNRMASMSFI